MPTFEREYVVDLPLPDGTMMVSSFNSFRYRESVGRVILTVWFWISFGEDFSFFATKSIIFDWLGMFCNRIIMVTLLYHSDTIKDIF